MKSQKQNKGQYFERQSKISLKCGLHSVNNLLRQGAYTEKEMNEICYSLSDDLINPHKHIIGGDYDANVVIIALENKGYSTNWIDKRKEYKVKKNLKGLLVNSQKERKFYHKIFKLSARHWATVVRDNDMYYHCDSEKEQLQEIGRIDELQKYINNLLKEENEVIQVCE